MKTLRVQEVQLCQSSILIGEQNQNADQETVEY